jgi:thiol:disulfide interchange protein
VLFLVLALIAFGIYRLVSMARGSIASSSSSGSGSSRSLADE